MIPSEATQKHILPSILPFILKVSLKTVILFASELLVKAEGWVLRFKCIQYFFLKEVDKK